VRKQRILSVIVGLLAIPGLAAAQELPGRVVEVSGGFAGFVDESIIKHGTLGAAVRWNLGRRLSVGPEIVYMNGGPGDQDLFLTGKLVVDFMPARAASPYFVADGGLMVSRLTFVGASDFWFREGAVSFGGGTRINLSPRMFLAPEVRIGWEPHIRFTVILGWRN
jgi:hypothetical protein